jgi:hypothetical protein
MKLNVTLCRNCDGSGLELQVDGSAACRFCGTAQQRPGVICPQCEEVNAPQAEQCAACRVPLFRACPACGARNWAGAAACSACGGALDLVEFVSAKWRSDFREDLKREAPALKAQEDAASQVRMGAMLAQEERRQQALQQAAARQQARQAQLLTFAMLGVGIFIVVIVIVLVVAALTR